MDARDAEVGGIVLEMDLKELMTQSLIGMSTSRGIGLKRKNISPGDGALGREKRLTVDKVPGGLRRRIFEILADVTEFPAGGSSGRVGGGTGMA